MVCLRRAAANPAPPLGEPFWLVRGKSTRGEEERFMVALHIPPFALAAAKRKREKKRNPFLIHSFPLFALRANLGARSSARGMQAASAAAEAKRVRSVCRRRIQRPCGAAVLEVGF